MMTEKEELTPEKEAQLNEFVEKAHGVLVNQVTAAAWDSFLISLIFGIMGIANLFQGGWLIALGAFQVFLSFLNFETGMLRRSLGRMFIKK